MPSTEEIHAETEAYYQELSEIPGYAEASKELFNRLRKTVEDFEIEHRIGCEDAWIFCWSQSPHHVRALHTALMERFPGVAEVKRKYRR